MGEERRKHGLAIEGEGLCPKCGGAGKYRYTLSWGAAGEGCGALLEVAYEFKCPFCGYTERARIKLPLKAAYYLRYLLKERAMVEVEKAWHALRLKAALDEEAGGCSE